MKSLMLDFLTAISQASAPRTVLAGRSKAQAHLSSFQKARPSIPSPANNPG
jgi:hypothetical protein